MDIEKKKGLIDQQTVVQELGRGRELMAELCSPLEGEFWPHDELADDLCKGIIEAFEAGISLVKSKSIDVTVSSSADSHGPPASAEEVHSPTSVLQMGRHSRRPYESGDPNPKNQKRRRPLSSSKTTVTDSPFSDGYQWRKYGQKIIRNVKHPRSYYKCTHTDCNAKLLVQQIEHSRSLPMYEVTRNNEHTCNTINPFSPGLHNNSAAATQTGSSFITFESDQLLPSFGSEELHHFFPSPWQQMPDRSAEILGPQSSDTISSSTSLLQHLSVPMAGQSREAVWTTEPGVEDSLNILSPPLSPAGQFYDASSYL